MKAKVGWPDKLPPGVRWILYEFFCWFNRHPGVARAIGSIFRRWPFLSHIFSVSARRDSVKHVLHRNKSFSNNAHNKNLIAAEFQIGMDPSIEYDADKALFATVLNKLHPQADADNEAQERITALSSLLENSSNSATNKFDLIDDYLTWVVFKVIAGGFDTANASLMTHGRATTPSEAEKKLYLREIRYVAAHLFAGFLAPLKVQRRAEVCAAALRDRIKKSASALVAAWAPSSTHTNILRTAIGYTWVSHPVTVQSGALAFQELMSRPKVYKALCEKAKKLEDSGQLWANDAFRAEVQNYVLELMRFRPIFPLLSRDVPRDTEFISGSNTNPKCPAGSSVTILSIAALFDATDIPDVKQFCSHRDWGKEKATRYMMFGYGDRQCPAKDHAVTMLTSAFIGLLSLGKLTWADSWGGRIKYEGPMISRMRLKRAYL
jgi:cytochrome P450